MIQKNCLSNLTRLSIYRSSLLDKGTLPCWLHKGGSLRGRSPSFTRAYARTCTCFLFIVYCLGSVFHQ